MKRNMSGIVMGSGIRREHEPEAAIADLMCTCSPSLLLRAEPRQLRHMPAPQSILLVTDMPQVSALVVMAQLCLE